MVSIWRTKWLLYWSTTVGTCVNVSAPPAHQSPAVVGQLLQRVLVVAAAVAAPPSPLLAPGSPLVLAEALITKENVVQQYPCNILCKISIHFSLSENWKKRRRQRRNQESRKSGKIRWEQVRKHAKMRIGTIGKQQLIIRNDGFWLWFCFSFFLDQ